MSWLTDAKRHSWAIAFCAHLLSGDAAWAQPVDLPIPAAKTDKYPPGVHVIRTRSGNVYADEKGRVLYGMDLRVLLRAGPDPSKLCTETCSQLWEPMLAPTGAEVNIAYPIQLPRLRGVSAQDRLAQEARERAAAQAFPYQPATAPDWTIIQSAQGPQWLYKGWHLVFARRDDKPGSTAFDGAESRTWNTLKFVPPVPVVAAPNDVKPIAIDGAYAWADKDGRVLFTGTCKRDCLGWQPLQGGLASAALGDWAVNSDGDVPQWTYRKAPVFVSREADPKKVPVSAKVLRP